MLNTRPYSASILAFSGLLLVGMGFYFIFFRPPLLAEDLQYMGATSKNIEVQIPGLVNWLQKVFFVLGGYIFTTGILTTFISFTSFRSRIPGAFTFILLSGFSSIVLMTVVNFTIGSDFKWLLLIFTLPWAIALILYKLHK